MTLNGRIVPRQDAPPDQLKLLGVALECWFNAFVADLASDGRDVEGWIDPEALKDLLAGELPQPFLLRVLRPGMKAGDVGASLERARAESPLLRRAMSPLAARCVCFGISVAGTRLLGDDVVSSIEAVIPMEWVAEVVVDW